MFRPWGLAEAEASWVTRGGWWHMDQAVETTINTGGQPVGGTHREYVQGFVTMVDTSPESGGFAVVADSHTQFAQLKGDPSAADYSKAIIPALKRGDLLMWDSRLEWEPANCLGRLQGRLPNHSCCVRQYTCACHQNHSPLKRYSNSGVGHTSTFVTFPSSACSSDL